MMIKEKIKYEIIIGKSKNNPLIIGAIDYCVNVVDGSFVSPYYVKRQCEEFLKDLESCSDGTNENWVLDFKGLNIIKKLLLVFNFYEDELAGLPILDYITGYQSMIIVAIFGFKSKKNINVRRYKKVLLMIARKNAKTFISSLIAILLMLTSPKNTNAYSVSATEKLATISKDMLGNLILNSGISEEFKVLKEEIRLKEFNTKFHIKGGNPNSINGIKPNICIIDELAQSRHDLVSVIQGGTILSKNKTIIIISTRYETDFEHFEEQVKYSKRVLSGEIKDERTFSLLYECENVDNWNTDDDEILKANPMCFYMPDLLDELKNLMREYITTGKENEFKTKNLNIDLPRDASSSFLVEEEIKDLFIKEYDWRNKRILIGCDLARVEDNTAIARVHYDVERDKYVVGCVAMIPESEMFNKKNRENIPYDRYIQKGWVEYGGYRKLSTEKAISKIEEYVVESGNKVDVIAFDRWGAGDYFDIFDDRYGNCKEVAQGFKMSDAVYKFRDLIIDGKIEFVENDFLKINMKNARKVSNNDGLMIDKKHSNGKIDMLMAILNVFCHITQNKVSSPSALNLWG